MNRRIAIGAILLAGAVISRLHAQTGPSITVPPDRALLIVRVPADAQVKVGGQPTTQKGLERFFFSPTLQPGKYTYEIEVAWTEGGQTRTAQERIEVQP